MSFHCRRPQRARGDTMKYFRQVGQMLEDAEKRARSAPAPAVADEDDDDDDVSEIGRLVTNTLNEMLGQEASLASNANTSFAVEKLTRHMNAKQLLAFIHNLSGLYCHLFTNRYSSHVVQTLLAQIAKFLTRSECVDEFVECIGHIVEELNDHFLDIVKDQSGSHALRTLVVILNGFEPVAKKQFTTAQLKKQRQRKKKKKAAGFEIEKPRSNANDVFQLYEDSPTASFEAPALFEDSLCGWASTLIELGHSLLTDTVLKNRHGAPFVQVLLLALHFNSVKIARAEPETASGASDDAAPPTAASLHRMCSTILPLDTDANIAAATDRYSFLAKHEFGSRVLEVLLQCTPDGHFAKVHHHAARSTAVELAPHPLANFVVQKYMKCVRELAQARHIVAAFVPKLATPLEDGDEEAATTQFRCKFDSTVVLGILKSERFSVITQLVNVVSQFKTRQDRVFSAVIDACLQLSGFSQTDSGAAASANTLRAIPLAQAAQVALLTILNVDSTRLRESAAKGDERYVLHTSVPRAQLVGALLALDATVSRPMVNALIALDQGVLEQFAQCEEISRGVLEVLVGGTDSAGTPTCDPERFRAERRQLLRRLLPVYTTLAGTMRGRFLVLKCFMAADAPTRFKIARTLAAQLRKLEGSKFGREVAEELRLELFERSHDDWSNAMKPRKGKGTGGQDNSLKAQLKKKNNKKNKKKKRNEAEEAAILAPKKRGHAEVANSADAGGGGGAAAAKTKKTKKKKKTKKSKSKKNSDETDDHSAGGTTGDMDGYDFLMDAIAATKN